MKWLFYDTSNGQIVNWGFNSKEEAQECADDYKRRYPETNFIVKTQDF